MPAKPAPATPVKDDSDKKTSRRKRSSRSTPTKQADLGITANATESLAPTATQQLPKPDENGVVTVDVIPESWQPKLELVKIGDHFMTVRVYSPARILGMFEMPARRFAETAGIELPNLMTPQESKEKADRIRELEAQEDHQQAEALMSEYVSGFASSSDQLMQAIGIGAGDMDVFAPLIAGIYPAISYQDYLNFPPEVKSSLVAYIFGDYRKGVESE